MAMSSCAAAAYSIRTIANAVVRHREQDRKIVQSSTMPMSEERMARLEAAVESIAIEVERISEGQRFTTRLLSENSQPMAPRLPQAGRFDTPH